MADEYTGPTEYINLGYKNIPIPINQYTGVRATYQTIPFLCIKKIRVENNLSNLKKKENSLNSLKKKLVIIREETFSGSKTIEEKNRIEKEGEQKNDNNNDKKVLNDKWKLELEKFKEMINFSIEGDYDILINCYIEEIKPIIDQYVYVRPDFGFEKLNLEIRQVPKEFVNLDNLDYVYLIYKKQSDFIYNKKVLEILKSFYDFKKAFDKNKNRESLNINDVVKTKLDYFFGESEYLDFLIKLKKTVYLLKTKGKFLKNEFDLIYKICLIFWNNYLLPFLLQIEFYNYFKFKGQENIKVMKDSFENFLNKNILNKLINSLQIIFDINDLSFFDQDLLYECKVVLYLSKLLELKKDYKRAYNYLLKTNKKIDNYRDCINGNFLRKRDEFLLPLCSTTNNLKINRTFYKMKISYNNWKSIIEQKLRILQRQKKKENRDLKFEELKEEFYENENFKKEFLENSNNDLKIILNNVKQKKHSEYDLLLISLQCEITFSLSRCMFFSRKSEFFQIEKGKTKIPPNLKNLIDFKDKKNVKNTLGVSNDLKLNLQSTKIIKSEEPSYNKKEKKMLNFAKKNNYLKSIFYATIAMTKEKIDDQENLLKKSILILEKQNSKEKILLKSSEENAIYLYHYSFINKIYKEKVIEEKGLKFWFDYLLEGIGEKKTTIPKKPILLKFNRNSITLRFPFFKPFISKKIKLESPEKETVNYMALFGKEIKDDNAAIGKNCKELNKTGQLFNCDKILNIKNLDCNKKYKFACIGYDKHQNSINKIGNTTDDIYTTLPLPINNIYFFIGKSAFFLRNYPIAKKALKKCFDEIVETFVCNDKYFGNKCFNIKFLKINYKNLKFFSIIDIGNFAEAINLYALCKYTIFFNKNKLEIKKSIFYNQIVLLQLINNFLVSSELGISALDYNITQKSLLYCYHYMGHFLKKRFLPYFILQNLIKIHSIILKIPKEYFNKNFSDLKIKITYFLLKAALMNKEFGLALRICCSDLNIKSNNYYMLPKIKEDNNEKYLDFIFKEKKNIQSNFYKFLFSLNIKFLNFFDYYEESIRLELNKLEDVDEKQTIILNLREVTDLFLMFEELKNSNNVNIKKFENSKDFKSYLCKYLEKCFLNNKKIVFDEYFLYFNNFDEFKIVSKIIELKINIIQIDEEWNPSNFTYVINEGRKEEEEIPDPKEKKDKNAKAKNLKKNIKKEKKEEEKVKILLTPFQIFNEYNKIIKSQYNEKYIYSKISLTNYKNFRFCAQFFYIKAQSLIKKNKKILKDKKNINHQFEGNLYSLNINFFQKQSKNNGSISRLKFYQKTQSNNNYKNDEEPLLEEENKILEEISDSILKVTVFALISKSYSLLFNALKTLYNFLKNINLSVTAIKKEKFREDLTLIIENSLYVIKLIDTEKEKLLNLDNYYNNDKRAILDTCYLFPEEKKIKNINKSDFLVVANLFSFILRLNYKNGKYNYVLYLGKLFCNTTNYYKSLKILPFITTILKKKIIRSEKNKNDLKKNLDDKNLELKEILKLKEDLITNKVETEEEFAEKIKNQESPDAIEDEKDDLIELISLEEKLKKLIEMDNENINKINLRLNQYERDLEQYETISKAQKRQNIENLKLEKIIETIRMINLSQTSNFQNNLQTQYQKEITYDLKTEIIETLKKKNDYNNLVIALHILAKFNHETIKDILSAEENWLEALDTVFQKLHAIKHTDTIFKSGKNIEEDFVDKYNELSLHISLVVLYKLAKFVYFKNLEEQRECQKMANCIISKLLMRSLPNPLSDENFKNYRMIDELYNNLYENPDILKIEDIVISLDFFSELNFGYNKNLENLKYFTYLEYLSEFKIFSNYYSLKSRIGKSISLAKCGFISEAIDIYFSICDLKFMPISDYHENDALLGFKGVFDFNNKIEYFNDLTPFDERNKEILELFFKKDETSIISFLKKEGIFLEIYFKISKQIIIFSLYQNENSEKLEYLKERENKLLGSLDNLKIIKKSLFQYDFLYSLVCINDNLRNSQKEIIKENFDILLNNYFDNLQIENFGQIKNDLKKFSNFNFKNQFLKLHSWLSILISEYLETINFTSKNFQHLKTSLNILKNFFFSNIYQEINFENKEENKENKKKNTKKTKKGKNLDINELVRILKESKIQICNLIKKDYTQIEFNFVYWIIIKTKISKCLFFQNKKKILIKFIKNSYKEFDIYKDIYFKRIIQGIEARFLYKNGNYKESLKIFEKIIDLDFYDLEQGSILGDYAELMFIVKNFDKATKIFKKCFFLFRKITIGIVKSGFEIKNWNNNEFIIYKLQENKNKIKSLLKENPLQSKKNNTRTNKEVKKKIKILPKKEKLMTIKNTSFLKKYDITKVNLQELEENIVKEEISIYNKNIEFYLKSLLRYLHLQILLNDINLRNIESLKTESIIEKKYILDELMLIYEKAHNLYKKNYFIPSFVKGEGEYIKSKILKIKGIYLLKEEQNKILKDNNSKSALIIKKKIKNQIICPNKYLIEIPNFSVFLEKTLLPIFYQSRECFLKCMQYLKGEKMENDFFFSIENAFMDIYEIDILISEYRPSYKFKYLQNNYMKLLQKNINPEKNIKNLQNWLDRKKEKEKNFINYKLWESSEYIKKSIDVSKAKNNLIKDFYKIDKDKNFYNEFEEKFPGDIKEEIKESKFVQYLKNEGKYQKDIKFDEIDLINYYIKLNNELKIFTFFGNSYQKQKIKIHKWFMNNNYFTENFIIKETGVKTNLKFDELMNNQKGLFLFKSVENIINDNIIVYYQLNNKEIIYENDESQKNIDSKSNEENVNKIDQKKNKKQEIKKKENILKKNIKEPESKKSNERSKKLVKIIADTPIKKNFLHGIFIFEKKISWEIIQELDKIEEILEEEMINFSENEFLQIKFFEILKKIGNLFLFVKEDKKIIKMEKKIQLLFKTNIFENFTLNKNIIAILKKIFNREGVKIQHLHLLMIFKIFHNIKIK